jgi:hypothetical protein
MGSLAESIGGLVHMLQHLAGGQHQHGMITTVRLLELTGKQT